MRRAHVRTPLPDAARSAAAITPDNTPELTSRIDGGAVVTTIERETAAGLRATLDDYLVNLAVAHATGRHADRYTDADTDTDTNTDPNANLNDRTDDHPTDTNRTDTP